MFLGKRGEGDSGCGSQVREERCGVVEPAYGAVQLCCVELPPVLMWPTVPKVDL